MERRMRRHWHINGRYLTQPVTGVQRYAHEIVAALDALLATAHPLASDLELTLIAPAHITVPRLQAIRHRIVRGGSGHGWEQLALTAAAPRRLISLCNTGPLAVRDQVVCIHDVNTRTCPESYAPAFRAFYRVLHPALGYTARHIATVSDYSADELARHRICRRDKIMVMPDGHEHAIRWKPVHSTRTAAAAGPRTILIIGSPAPHKNVDLILRLAPDLAAAGLRVAVAGLRDAKVFNKTPGLRDAENVFWLGRITNEELAALLRDCLCLAMPSFVEGFGLPALEAMALGCPVVVSDRASLPEVCGNAALYAAPTEPEAWLAHFVRLASDGALRQTLVARGRAQARRFSWMRSAEGWLAMMAQIDGIPVRIPVEGTVLAT
jgi:glycosyltransferase involved in cell wall biosynthesis